MERFHPNKQPADTGKPFNSQGTKETRNGETFSDPSFARDLAFAMIGLQLTWTTAPNGSVVDDIPMWRAYTGQATDEVLGSGWLNALHPQEHTKVTHTWLQSIASRTPFEAEFRLKRSDGSYNYFLARALPLFAESDVIHAWVGVCTNITQQSQQRAQEEATRRARLLKTAFETITDGIIVFDDQGHILQENAAASHMMDLKPLAANTHKVTAEERFQAFSARNEYGQPLQPEHNPLKRILQNETLTGTNTVNLSIFTPDQREVFINVSGAPMLDREGHITGAVCIYRDITKSRQLERRTEMLGALVAMAETLVQSPTSSDQTNKAHLHSLLMHMVGQRIVELTQKMLRCQGVGIITIDPESKVIHPVATIGHNLAQEHFFFQAITNSRLTNLLLDPGTNERLQSGEILTLDLEKLIPPEQLQISNWRIILAAPIRIGQQFIGLLYTAFESPLHVYTEEEIELVGTMAKLSALAIERERRETKHERLLVVLQEANTQLEQINKLQNDFISIISHEFRTTLTGIQGFSELLRDEDFSPEEVKEYASDIHTDARRLTRLIGELLDLESMKLGKIELHQQAVNLNTILQEVAEHIRPVATRHSIRLHLISDLPSLQGDGDKLKQVVTNLVTNAVKYSPAGGEILLTTQLEETVVHMSIEDHGIGIPKEAYEQIFMQYNRIEGDSTRYITGPGLGLPLVHQIVQMHGGHVWVESRLGLGSTFHVALPLIHIPNIY